MERGTAYLDNDGSIKNAQAIAADGSPQMAKHYGRTANILTRLTKSSGSQSDLA